MSQTAKSRYVTYPEFANLAPITVTSPASGTAPGYVFYATLGRNTTYDPAMFIIDNFGEPVYVRNFPDVRPLQIMADFKKQTVNGRDYLTYHLGGRPDMVTTGKFYVLDQSYTLKSIWDIRGGFEQSGVDSHEFKLLDNGHAILFSYVEVPYDLSPYGGPEKGKVLDVVMQEQDAARNVVFQWRGLDHIPLTDTYMPLTTTTPVDYMHTNAIDVDTDGNWLVSNRNTAEIIKINRSTGKLMWRMGGKKNEFKINDDKVFSYQHDIRRQPNGRVTLFDNGNLSEPNTSRFVEYTIDEVNKVLTRTWQFTDNNKRFTPANGNAQRLPNGNTIGSWGRMAKVTEVTPQGEIAFDVDIGGLSYRAFRFSWEATPTEAPRLAALYATDPTTATLYFSWNGATGITAYDIYAGSALTGTTLVTTTARTGFETRAALAGLPAGTCVFQVRPARGTDRSLPLSNPIFRLDSAACRAASDSARR